MLNRSSLQTSAPTLPMNWGALLRGLLSGPNAWLMQLAVIAVVVSLLACVYLWQSSAIRDLQTDTQSIQQKSADLERQNVGLMLQVAGLNSPAYIETKAREQGMVLSQPSLVLQVPNHAQATPNADSGLGSFTSGWQHLIDRIPGSAAVIQAAAWMR
jgi:cell division protein FtsL